MSCFTSSLKKKNDTHAYFILGHGNILNLNMVLETNIIFRESLQRRNYYMGFLSQFILLQSELRDSEEKNFHTYHLAKLYLSKRSYSPLLPLVTSALSGSIPLVPSPCCPAAKHHHRALTNHKQPHPSSAQSLCLASFGLLLACGYPWIMKLSWVFFQEKTSARGHKRLLFGWFWVLKVLQTNNPLEPLVLVFIFQFDLPLKANAGWILYAQGKGDQRSFLNRWS